MATLPMRDSLQKMINGQTSDGEGTSSARFHGGIAATQARLDEKAFLDALRQDVCGTDVLGFSVEGFIRDTVAVEAMMANTQQ